MKKCPLLFKERQQNVALNYVKLIIPNIQLKITSMIKGKSVNHNQ